MSSPRLRLIADVRDQMDTLRPGEVGIGPEGDLWMIAYDRPPTDIYRTDPHTSLLHGFTVLNFREGLLKAAIPIHEARRRSFVQPLGEHVLLVASRTAGEPNAQVADARGATRSEFNLGDGIEDVQTTLSGEVWVSYNDQGTCVGCWPVDGSLPARAFDPANLGDGSKNEHYGLLRVTGDGEVKWRYSDTATIEPIFWCDGLNVFGDGSAVWASYTIFPGLSDTCSIVRIDPHGARRLWRLDRHARRALAVHGETILLGGGYGESPDAFLLGRLSKGDAVENLQPIAWIPHEQGIGVRVIGRGPALHLIQGTRWYVMDLRD